MLTACSIRQETVREEPAPVSFADLLTQMPKPAYAGPKARVQVRRFSYESQAAWYNDGVAQSMADQLMLALGKSGRFVFQKPRLGAELSGVGGGAPIGQEPEGGGEDLSLIVLPTIKSYSGSTGTGRVSPKPEQVPTRMAIALNLIDATSGDVLAIGQIAVGSSVPFTGNRPLVGQLYQWRDTTRGDALLQLVDRATEFITNHLPLRYYRYDRDGTLSFRARIGGGFSDILVEAQAALTTLGYQPGPIDGLLGEKTESALQAFRKDQGIERTGPLDIETLRALRIQLQRQK